MSVYFMHDNHTFTRLDNLCVDEAMRRARISTKLDHGIGFIGCKEPHGDTIIQWRPGENWEPRVKALLEQAATTDPKL